MIYKEDINGKYTNLRYVKVEDAEFILTLRTNPKYSHYINETENDLNLQNEWILNQQCNPNDYYFIIRDLNGKPKGVISLYNFDFTGKSAEFGRVICPNSPLQLNESISLVLSFGFETLGLKRIFDRINPINAEAIASTRRFGAEFVGYGNYQNNNVPYIEFQVLQKDWALLKARNIMRLENFIGLSNKGIDSPLK
jgi:RimJ/RimL family protein N-acetyltransferase